jgi:hypothetical protein
MAPALLVELGGKSRRHPRRFAVVGGIAGRARRAWRPAAASAIAIPRSFQMAFAHPAAILAKIAFHVHRDRKARARAPRKRPLRYISGPHSQFEIFS